MSEEQRLDVDAWVGELATAPAAPARPPSIAKVRYTHDAMIDLILERPMISQNEIAAIFGYGAPWVSVIMSSDAFKARLEERREEIVDPAIRATIKERFEALTKQSLDILAQKLAQPATAVSDVLALRAAELGMKALGMGQPQQTVAVVVPGRLENLAGRLLALQRQARGEHVTEGEVVNHAS